MRPHTSTAAVRTIPRGLRRTKHRRLVALAACAAALLGTSPAAAAASIVYTPTYKTLIAAFPSGSADDCDIYVVLHPADGGFCDARIDLLHFYPDGTLGAQPWHVDDSSPTGWSIEPDPCDGLTGEQYQQWAAYVDHANGYLDSGPDLASEQVDRYGACWGWWF